MKRLQFWKKSDNKKDVSEKRPLESSFAEPYRENGTAQTTHSNGQGSDGESAEVLQCPEKNRDASNARDPDLSAERGDAASTTKWPRDPPSLSFETFKGPQQPAATPAESSSDSGGGPESRRDNAGLLPQQQTPSTSFEVIYSQVNKNKQGRPVPGDQAEVPPSGFRGSGEVTATDVDTSKQEMPRASDVSAVSFDDVLESFQVSLNDLQALADSTSAPNKSSPRDPGASVSNVNNFQDNYVEIETINRGPVGLGGDYRGAMDNYGVDVDLMMSDEIIVRPRKKSVTFNERIQERPLSIGESDVTSDDVTGNDDVTDHVCGNNGFIPNGVDKPHANGVRHQNGYISNHSQEYSDEDVEITVINQHAVKQRELQKLVQLDEGVSVTSPDELTNEEEDLLRKEPIKIRRLLWTRTLIVIFTWISLATMEEAITTSFPFTHTSLNVTMETLSRAHITHGAGCVVSAILTAILSTYLSCDMFVWIVLGLVVMTTAMAWLPWCASMATVWTFYGLTGFGEFMIMMASVYLVIQLWAERKRDGVIHVLFVSKAAAAALVPHISRVLGPLLGPWALPGLTYRVSRNTSAPVDPGVVANTSSGSRDYDYGNYLITIISLDIPPLFPVYFVLSLTGVVAAVLLCVVLGYSQCQVSKRNDMECKVKKIRKKKLKQQIKLVGLQDVHLGAQFNTKVPGAKDSVNNNNKATITIEIQEVLSQVHDIRRAAHVTGNTHVEEQVAKLLEYATYLHSQGQASDRNDAKTKGPIRSRNTWLQGNQTFGVDSQMYLYVFFTMSGGLTMTLSQFLYIYARDRMVGDMGFEDDLVFTLYWGAVALSRLIAFPVSRLVSPNAIMITCLVTNMSSSAIMLAYADRFPVLLWLFGGLLGASVGPILPGGFTWANIYFNLKRPKALGLVFVFWGVGAMLFPWCCGFVIHNWGLSAMFYMTVVTAGLAFLLYIPVLITVSRREIFDIASARSSVSSVPMRTYL